MSSKTHINSLQAGAFYHKSENENRNFGKQGKKFYIHACQEDQNRQKSTR